MAILLTAVGIRKSFAARPLFENLSFTIESGERIGLIGPNGAGKSTLLRILASKTEVDEGKISFQRGLRVGYLEQVPQFSEGSTILSTLLEGFQYDWEHIAQAEEIISKLSLGDSSQPIQQLSGGWKKRVALGRELIKKPDLLLLDEPTNHLDVEGILWLEEFISNFPFSVLTITHDRLFLQRIAQKIWELDRRNLNGLLSVKGNYATYLEIKEQTMAAQERREVVLKNTFRRETEWLKRGAKARTTKQQARIQRAHYLKDEIDELNVRNQTKTARLSFESLERNPNKLIEAKNVSKSYGDQIIFKNLDLLMTPGKRIGILGPNGAGKSTLVRVLLGLEELDQGTIFRAENLSVSYFEQNRESLDPNLSVLRTLCPQGDFVTYQGNRIHIRSYLDRFLFSQDQTEMAVGKLSGGEQSRVLLAKLMLQEANLLVLDEPTNDLDLATLNVLEECLIQFKGAIILVTHDRYFLDQVANQILAIGTEGSQKGKIVSFSSLEQWEDWHAEQNSETQLAKNQISSKKLDNHSQSHSLLGGATPPTQKKRKLSFNEQRELDTMESRIHQAEERLAQLTSESILPENTSNSTRLVEITNEMTQLQEEIDRLYSRWAELET